MDNEELLLDDDQQDFVSSIGQGMQFISENFAHIQYLVFLAQDATTGFLAANGERQITQEMIDSIPSFKRRGVQVVDLERGIDILTSLRNFNTAFPDTVQKLARLP